MAKPNPKADLAFIQQSGMKDPDMRQMLKLHENSAENSLLEPVNLGNGGRHRQDPAQSLSPTAAQTLKRSHWKSIDDAKHCAEPTCRKKFARFDRRRNCCMCGLVFCRKCTQYRRKLSPNAVPDIDFGTVCHVCRSCFEKDTQEAENIFDHDWTGDFQYYREQAKARGRSKIREKSEGVPLSATSGVQKRDRIRSELDRLCTGFEANHGLLKDFFADFKTPQWQKSGHWVNAAQKQICQNCNENFKKMAKKINCRVCGQVYCSRCAKEEIIMFIPSGQKTAEWFINGKESVSKQHPTSFLVLPVCGLCCDDLQMILLDKISEQKAACSIVNETDEPDFMESLKVLHQSLVKMKIVVETRLPDFQKFVDSMDIADGATRSTPSSKNPIGDLARATCDLSDQFSQLAIESQNLRRLQPTTPTQARLLKYVCLATYKFYDDNMYIFRVTKKRLEVMMPIETLNLVQDAINQRSLEVVHFLVKQICFEAINVELHRGVPCDSITSPLSKCVDTLEWELSELYTDKELDWGEHARDVSLLLKDAVSGDRKKIKINNIPKNMFRNQIVTRKLLRQVGAFLRTSFRELDAKTPMNVFASSKGELRQLANEFDDRAAQLLKTHPQAFQNGRR